jgi:hypothetical protein
MWTRLKQTATPVNVFLLFFFLALTFQYTLPGVIPLEYSLVELVVFTACAILVLVRADVLVEWRQSVVSNSIVRLFLVWGLWAAILWIISRNWAYSLIETRWILLSCAALIVLLPMVRSDGEKVLWIFLGVSVAAAVIADVQGLTGLFTPPFALLTSKDIFVGVDEAVTQSVAVGFFRHPNAFGGYVFWPLLIALGFLHDRRKRWIALALVLLFGFSLYLSYYRTLLLGLGFALALYILLWLRPSPRLLAVSAAGLSILAVAASALALQLAPNLSFFNNLWFRINLWHKAFTFIQQSPIILLFGSGFNPSAALSSAAARVDPHDVFLYMLMHYGIPGLLIFLGIIWVILRKGWLAYRDGLLLHRPVLAALWVGWIAWFLTDLIDSRLTTPEWQMLFIAVLAIYWGGLAAASNPPASHWAEEENRVPL